MNAEPLPPPVLDIDPDLVWVRNVQIDAAIELRRARRRQARWRRDLIDTAFFRCPGCDALLLPSGLMEVRHACFRTTGRSAA